MTPNDLPPAAPDFALHPRLAADTFVVGDFPLSRLLLMNETTYPWLILVPRRPDLREIFELSEVDQQQLLRESSQVAATLHRLFRPDKLNLATLGNLVPQLHVHHVARFRTDPAWPGPVWGHSPPRPYGDTAATETLALLRDALANLTPVPR